MKEFFSRRKAEIIIFIIMLLGLLSPVQAKIREIKSSSMFNKIIGEHSHAVVLFYDYNRAMKKSNPDMFTRNSHLESVFKTVASRGAYEEAGIQFLLVNIVKDGLWSTAKDYGFNNYPICVLFKNGNSVATSSAQESIIRGFATASQLHAMINTCWGDDIDQLIQDKQEERREIARERAVYGPSIGFGFGGYPYYGGGWGYPYGGYGGYGYWGRPRFGFGIGF